MRRKDLVVYAIDVGSVKRGNVAWASSTRKSGNNVDTLISVVSEDFAAAKAVALGFGCPLWISLADHPEHLSSARHDEGVRPWPDGFDGGALAYGLTRSTQILAQLRQVSGSVAAHLDWGSFAQANGARLLVWETFITGTIKGAAPEREAAIAVDAFLRAFPDLISEQAVAPGEAHSLIGAAMLRTGWSSDPSVLGRPCLMITASAKPVRSQEEREDEIVSYLVRRALSQWFRDHGQPAIADFYAKRAQTSPDASQAAERKPRSRKR